MNVPWEGYRLRDGMGKFHLKVVPFHPDPLLEADAFFVSSLMSWPPLKIFADGKQNWRAGILPLPRGGTRAKERSNAWNYMVLPVIKKVACRRPRIKWKKPTYIINSPFHLISQHVVHWGYHLDWHIYQPLTQHETDVCIWLRKQSFQSFVERRVVGGRNRKKVVGDGLYRGILLWYWRWYFLHNKDIVKS